MQDEGVIYVAGHLLLNRRCTRLPECIRLWNDVHCVGWGVKLCSLTHLCHRHDYSVLRVCHFQIIKDRVMGDVVRSAFTWNTAPGSLMILPEFSQSLDTFPFYWRHLGVSANTSSSSMFTAVVYITGRSSFGSASPLHRLLRALSRSARLHKVGTVLFRCVFVKK